MKKLSRSVIVAIVLAVALVGVSTYAVVMFTFTNTSTMHVVADYSIEVRIKATNELFDVYDWGYFLLNEVKEVVVTIYNIGIVDVYVSWTRVSVPTNWQLTLYYTSDVTPWNPDFKPYKLIYKGDSADARINLECLTEVIGDYGFTLYFHSHETDMG